MRDCLSLDGDASGTQRVYTGSGQGCPTSNEIGGLYCLAPKDACSRGVQAGCERGLSPRSRLGVVDRALIATLCVWTHLECGDRVLFVWVDLSRL